MRAKSSYQSISRNVFPERGVSIAQQGHKVVVLTWNATPFDPLRCIYVKLLSLLCSSTKNASVISSQRFQREFMARLTVRKLTTRKDESCFSLGQDRAVDARVQSFLREQRDACELSTLITQHSLELKTAVLDTWFKRIF